MNAKEILWRLEQKKSQHREKVRFANSDMDITSSLFYEEISHLSFDAGRLGLNLKNKKFGVRTDIHLLGSCLLYTSILVVIFVANNLP